MENDDNANGLSSPEVTPTPKRKRPTSNVLGENYVPPSAESHTKTAVAINSVLRRVLTDISNSPRNSSGLSASDQITFSCSTARGQENVSNNPYQAPSSKKARNLSPIPLSGSLFNKSQLTSTIIDDSSYLAESSYSKNDDISGASAANHRNKDNPSGSVLTLQKDSVTDDFLDSHHDFMEDNDLNTDTDEDDHFSDYQDSTEGEYEDNYQEDLYCSSQEELSTDSSSDEDDYAKECAYNPKEAIHRAKERFDILTMLENAFGKPKETPVIPPKQKNGIIPIFVIYC
ncbi:predicted protein [Arabidopsis lyrata subsp. lyrata]|uniref:Predicted protein n=1 Tax=Arabidopsis lyrata subsp. lyrata TaxID=81972 RepID=D7MVK2_ARALL|nr:predicted protein [Arabidopsis lyrata subsp. lyrata]